MAQSTNRTLVLCLALNGYHALYRNHIEKHRAYAQQQGYEYLCVERPRLTLLDIECTWLKISLIIKALEQKYDWVVCLDADTEVRTSTPNVESLYVDGKYIYMAKGFSNRFNSGVLILKNHGKTLRFMRQVFANHDKALVACDDVGWGENGHIIYFAKRFDIVQEIDKRWNNNHCLALADYIRHYSYGPLHQSYSVKVSDKLEYQFWHYALAIWKRYHKLVLHLTPTRPKSFIYHLDKLTGSVCNDHPEFFGSAADSR